MPAESTFSSDPSNPSPTIETLAPKPTDRALFVGQTGSGKTTLAEVIVRDAHERRGRHVVVVDAKGLIKWPGYVVVTTLKKAIKSKETRLTYRPSYAELRNLEMQELAWEWLYKRGHTTIYVDETAAIVQGDIYPHYYGATLMRGREMGLELYSATQRPMKIPQITLSESEHVYAFRLRLPQDRQRVEALTSIPQERIAALQKQEFLYGPQDGDVQGPLKLALG